MKLRVSIVLAGCSLAVFAQGQGNQGEGNGNGVTVLHRTNQNGSYSPAAGSTGTLNPAIEYHGGPVMGTPTPYLIWYGNWNQSNGTDTPAGQQIVRDFLHGLSGSNYYVTNASYAGVSGMLTVSGLGNGTNGSQEFSDNYSQGKNVSDNGIGAIVSNAIAHGLGGASGDPNGIYLVLTSSDVNETSGFCTQYCGWHSYGTLGNNYIKFAFVGNANRCLSGCAAQTVSPNGNAGVDGMVSVIAHETEETNTDPLLNAWYDRRGSEDADKCAWTFGSHQTLLNGAYYNVTLPGISTPSRNYLIQRELASNSRCYIDYVNKLQ